MAICDDIKTVIGNGGYDLVDLLHRIDVIYVSGQLTDEEREELYELARAGANPDDSLGPVTQRLDAVERAVRDLQTRVQNLEDGTTAPGSQEKSETEEWPEYVQPTGAHDAYWNGDKVTWQGGHYTCTAPEGVACVWDPGTYPAYWHKDN